MIIFRMFVNQFYSSFFANKIPTYYIQFFKHFLIAVTSFLLFNHTYVLFHSYQAFFVSIFKNLFAKLV